MNTQIEALDLNGLGFTDQEICDVLASANRDERIRLLRRGRGRLLEDLHRRQQALDRLDYLIYQIRKNSS